MKRTILSLALLLLVPARLSAQENTCLRRVLPVSVVGRDEVPVAGLTAENFRGSFRGAPIRIRSVTWTAGPRRIVVVLDLSGSMSRHGEQRSSNKTATIELLADDVLQSAHSNSEFALIGFAETVKLLTPLSRDREPALAWIDKIVREERKMFKGRTAFFDALGEAVTILSPTQPGDAIYLLSDGADNASRTPANKIEERLLSAGVRLFGILLQDPDPKVRAVIIDESEQTIQMVERTGGAAFFLHPPELAMRKDYDLSAEGRTQIRKVANLLYQQLEKFYEVEIELPQEVDKLRPWKLELNPSGTRQVKGLSLHYPQKLLPCSTAKATQQPSPQ